MSASACNTSNKLTLVISCYALINGGICYGQCIVTEDLSLLKHCTDLSFALQTVKVTVSRSQVLNCKDKNISPDNSNGLSRIFKTQPNYHGYRVLSNLMGLQL